MKIPRLIGLLAFIAIPMTISGIEFRYDYDTSGVFNHPGAQDTPATDFGDAFSGASSTQAITIPLSHAR